MDQKAYSELSLRELRVLNALLQLRSITRTAQAMETTQPAISKMLRRLRAQFSDPLFVRNGQAMQPTAKALDIADRLRVLLAAADGLAFRGNRIRSGQFGSAVQPAVDRCRHDQVSAAVDRARCGDRAWYQRARGAAGCAAVRAQARNRRGGSGVRRVSEGRPPSAAAAPVFRRLFQRAPQAPSARVEIPVAVGLSRRTPHSGDGIGDRTRRAPYRAPRIVFGDRACQRHAAGSELYCRRHCRGGDGRCCDPADQPGAAPCRSRSVLSRSKPRSRCRASRSPNSGMSVTTATPATNG